LDVERGNGSRAVVTVAPAADDVPTQPILTIRNLSKTFPGTRALDGVDFDVRPGEVHALVGQNGSGKSTLIKVLAGFHRPDPGAEAQVNGERYQLGDSDAAHDAGLRFVHQDLGLVSTLDAVDNLALGVGYLTGRGNRIRWRQQADLARRAIGSLGYDVDVETPVGRLEPLERTAVAIARALRGIDGVSLLVLDEPTAAMPRPDVERLFEIVRRVRQRGVGVLYVSHHLDEVFTIADRVTVLRDGRNFGTDDVGAITPRSLVERMTGGWADEAPPSTGVDRGEPVLCIRGLAGRELRSLDLVVHAGEVVGVAGINGSGREEVCGLVFGGRPRRGTVTVSGAALAPMSPDESVALGVGFVPADRHRDGLVLSFSVRENLTLSCLGEFRRRFRLQHRDERRHADLSITELGVKTPTTEATVESLSGGNQQKVVLGRWLGLRTRALLLDEPTQGVDVAAKADVHQLVDKAAGAGTAVLVASSDEAELERLCDRVVVIHRGRAAAELCRPHINARRIAQTSLAQVDGPAGSADP
jgi:ribose transport system ATP-binding protein